MKFVFTGPESSGKSTLSKWLADQYKWYIQPELARVYLQGLDRPYLPSDILHLSDLQVRKELDMEDKFIVLDTDILTLFIWMTEVFPQKNADVLLERFQYADTRHYFLCKPDIPWESDPLRENPHDRDRLYKIHLQLLTHYDKEFTVIAGDKSRRQDQIDQVVSKFT